MTLATPIEGIPDGKWDHFETDVVNEGTNQGGWEFTVKFKTEDFDLPTY